MSSIVESLKEIKLGVEGSDLRRDTVFKYPYQKEIVRLLIERLQFIGEELARCENDFLSMEISDGEFSKEFIFEKFKKSVELKGRLLGTLANARYMFLEDISEKKFLDDLMQVILSDGRCLFPPFEYGFVGEDVPNFSFRLTSTSSPSDAKRLSLVFCESILNELIDMRKKIIDSPYVKGSQINFISFRRQDGGVCLTEDIFANLSELRTLVFERLLSDCKKNYFYQGAYVFYIVLKLCGLSDDRISDFGIDVHPDLVSERGFVSGPVEVRKQLESGVYDTFNFKLVEVLEKMFNFEEKRVYPNQINAYSETHKKD